MGGLALGNQGRIREASGSAAELCPSVVASLQRLIFPVCWTLTKAFRAARKGLSIVSSNTWFLINVFGKKKCLKNGRLLSLEG